MGELLITFGEDGKAHMYNRDFDVTIHCENEQQMNEAVELLHLANRMHWRKTAENPPTEKHVKETAYNRQMMGSGSVYHRDHEDRHREKGKKKHFGQNGGDK